MKQKAIIHDSTDDIKWLIIEKDTGGTNGFFLYYHKDETTAFDSWFENLEDAYKAAHDDYNVKRSDWQVIEE